MDANEPDKTLKEGLSDALTDQVKYVDAKLKDFRDLIDGQLLLLRRTAAGQSGQSNEIDALNKRISDLEAKHEKMATELRKVWPQIKNGVGK